MLFATNQSSVDPSIAAFHVFLTKWCEEPVTVGFPRSAVSRDSPSTSAVGSYDAIADPSDKLLEVRGRARMRGR